jgi:Flp pilus assembly protein TadD
LDFAVAEYRGGQVDAPDDAVDANRAAAQIDEGDSLYRQHRYAEAETAYRTAIALDPRLPRAYCGLGLLLNRAKRYEEAEAACREAIRLDPDFTRAHDNLGKLLSAPDRPSRPGILRRPRR